MLDIPVKEDALALEQHIAHVFNAILNIANMKIQNGINPNSWGNVADVVQQYVQGQPNSWINSFVEELYYFTRATCNQSLLGVPVVEQMLQNLEERIAYKMATYLTDPNNPYRLTVGTGQYDGALNDGNTYRNQCNNAKNAVISVINQNAGNASMTRGSSFVSNVNTNATSLLRQTQPAAVSGSLYGGQTVAIQSAVNVNTNTLLSSMKAIEPVQQKPVAQEVTSDLSIMFKKGKKMSASKVYLNEDELSIVFDALSHLSSYLPIVLTDGQDLPITPDHVIYDNTLLSLGTFDMSSKRHIERYKGLVGSLKHKPRQALNELAMAIHTDLKRSDLSAREKLFMSGLQRAIMVLFNLAKRIAWPQGIAVGSKYPWHSTDSSLLSIMPSPESDNQDVIGWMASYEEKNPNGEDIDQVMVALYQKILPFTEDSMLSITSDKDTSTLQIHGLRVCNLDVDVRKDLQMTDATIQVSMDEAGAAHMVDGRAPVYPVIHFWNRNQMHGAIKETHDICRHNEDQFTILVDNAAHVFVLVTVDAGFYLSNIVFPN